MTLGYRPLRRMIPLAIIVFGLVLSLADYVFEMVSSQRRIQASAQQRLMYAGAQLAVNLDLHLQEGRHGEIARIVSTFATMPGLLSIHVLDEQNVVLFSSDFRSLGKSLPAGANSPSAPLMIQARHSLAAQSELVADGRQLYGVFPLQLPLQSGELRSQRVGLVVLLQDLSPDYAARDQDSIEHAVVHLGVLSLFLLLLWWWLRQALVRRIGGLVHSAQRLVAAGGRMPAGSVRVEGSDEIADLARAFVSLLETLSERNRQLMEVRDQVVSARDFYKTVIDGIPNPMWRAGVDAKCDYFNHAWLDFTGRSLQQELGDGWTDGVHPEDYQRCLDVYLTAFHQRQPFYMEYRLRHCDGSYHWLADYGKPLFDHAGQFLGYIGSCYDLQSYRDTETLLRERSDELADRVQALTRADQQLRLAASVFEHSREMILITDAQQRIVRVNQAFSDITGYAVDEVLGQTPSLLKSGLQDAAFYKQLWDSLEARGYWQGELWNRRKHGEVYPVWLTISVVRDEQGKVLHYLGVSSDISETKESQSRIQHLAYYDPLTELPNRVLFHDRVEQALMELQSEHDELAVLYLDLDHFKTVNDSLGHVAGDSLLREVAQRLRQVVRAQDTVARLGGDEFGVLLPHIGATAAVHVAQDVLAMLAQPFELDQPVHVTPSIGIVVAPRDGHSFNDLLKHADAAMYKAKALGRNAYQFYTPELNAAALERLMLENALRHALRNHEFMLHYQPQFDARDVRLIGAEALLRWRHAEMGMISPGRFIPIAEESGQIAAIGAWVLAEACRQNRAWQLAGLPPLVMAVNISPRQFVLADLCSQVRAALEASGLEAQWLELEITESVLVHNMEATLATLRELKAIGVHLSIDDFGTGYSSLAYLTRFPIDKLKIDQSFVRDLVDDDSDRAVAAGVVNLGHSLSMTVIAEGVENAEQLELLRSMGCDHIQGFHLGRPMPAPQMMDCIRSGKCTTTDLG